MVAVAFPLSTFALVNVLWWLEGVEVRLHSTTTHCCGAWTMMPGMTDITSQPV